MSWLFSRALVAEYSAALRGMFPDAKADDMNFVLFSTSGVHGTYNTIEEAEKHLAPGKD